jgi:hypothetical protein
MKKKNLKEAIPLKPGSKGSVTPGAAPAPSSVDIQALQDKLQKVRRALIVQNDQGQPLKIQKNADGTFSAIMGALTFDQPIGSQKMSVNDVVGVVSNFTQGKKFDIPVEEQKKMNKDFVKMELLRRKINEHFSKKPKSKILIVKANLGESNLAWKVTRSKKGIHIVEVNTKRKEYLMEAPGGPITPGGTMGVGGKPVGGQAPASQTQVPGQMSSKLLSDPFYLDLIAQPSAEKMAEVLVKNLAKVSEPLLKVVFASLMRESPNLGKLLSDRRVVQMMGKIGSQLQASYDPSLREAPEEEKPEDKEKEKSNKEPKPLDKEPEPKEDPGLETAVDNSAESDVQPELDPQMKSPAQTQLTNRVKGQVVKDMIVDSSQDGLNVSIDFATMSNNLDIEYRKSDGHTTWKLGELSDVIKPGVESQKKTDET